MNRLIGLAGVSVLWELLARLLHHPVFPPITSVLPSLVRLMLSGEASRDISASMQHVAIGFSLAVLVGVTLGILIAELPWLRVVSIPVIDAVRPVAAITLFPLIILVMGLGLWSKVFVIFWTAWPAILLNTIHGIHQVDQNTVEAAALDGANRWQILARIALPLAMPTIMMGLRIGMSGGWISLIAAEMLGANAGLGFAVLRFSQTFRFPEMYAAIILIAVLGLATNQLLAWIQWRLELAGGFHATNSYPVSDPLSRFTDSLYRSRTRPVTERGESTRS